MLSFFTYPINRFGAYLSVACFCIGTLLFLLQLALDHETITSIGVLFVVLAFCINSITLFFIVIHSLYTFKDLKEHCIVIVLMLSNFPIAAFYMFIIPV